MKVTAVLVSVDSEEDLKRLLHYVNLNGKVSRDTKELEQEGSDPAPSIYDGPQVTRRKLGGQSAADPTTSAPNVKEHGGSTSTEPAIAGATENPSSAPSASSRRRRPGAVPSADGNQGAEPISEDISDSDLVKAASLAASKVGADRVKEIVGEYAVKTLDQLTQPQRRHFIDRLSHD